MEIILYAYIYIIGVLLGSFFTLAVHRIPQKQDITHTRSYCPNCNHRLNFFDLIPVLSYIFLGGKCRYCHQKIRPRYLIIELMSGLVFLLFAMFLNIDIFNIEPIKISVLIFGILYISTIFLTVAILKEYKKVEKSVLTFGIIAELLYITYLYVFKLNMNIYKYIIYLVLLIILLAINAKMKKDIIRKIMFIIFLLVGIINIVTVLL